MSAASDLAVVCRACLNEPLHWFELSKDFRELFEKCTEVSLTQVERDNPPLICSMCWERCENWQEFRKMCQQNDTKVQKRHPLMYSLKDSHHKMIPKNLIEFVDVPSNKSDESEDELEDANRPEDEDFPGTTPEIPGPQCKRSYKNQLGLKAHIDKHHRETLPVAAAAIIPDSIKCPICNLLLDEEEAYDNHIREHYAEPTDRKCLVCSKLFATRRTVITHTHEHSLRRIPCPKCERTYPGRPQLHKHIARYHANDGAESPSQLAREPLTDILQCPVCLEVSEDEYSFDNHIRAHYSDTDRKCLLCDQEFPAYRYLIRHTHGHSNRQIRCPFCPRVYNTRVKLDKHKNKYHRGEIIDEQVECEELEGDVILEYKNSLWCTVCRNTFETEDQLENHFGDCLLVEDRLECPVCQEVLATEKLYDHHIRNHYKDQEEHQCLICNKEFKSINTVTVHTQEHGSRSVPCRYCPKTFKGRQQWLSHQNKYHYSEIRRAQGKHIREYTCPVCSKSFNQKHRLNAHMTNHSTTTAFICEHCPQSFKTQRTLRVHQLQHTAAPTISCPKCDMKFYHSRTMHDHMRRHNAKPEHECEICHKMFSYKAGLAEHMNTHTKERSFVCEHCGKEFNRVSVLNRHRELHENRSYACDVCGKSYKTLGQHRSHMKSRHKKNATSVGV